MMDRTFGLETEFAFTALDRDGQAMDRATGVGRLFDLAKARLKHLPGSGSTDLYEDGSGTRVDLKGKAPATAASQPRQACRSFRGPKRGTPHADRNGS